MSRTKTPRRELTNRGFALYTWIDTAGDPCSLQKSSIATDDRVWLGLDEPRPMYVLGSPQPFDLPPGVKIFGRMHLSRAQARKLAKLLAHFAETGEL